VLCAPGFPSSRDDSDKPFLLNHALALVSAGFDVTVVCPSAPGLPNRQIVEGIKVVRTRYAPRRFETLAATGSMYREARGFRSVLVAPMIVALIVAAVRESRKNDVIALHGHWWVPGGLVAVLASFCTRTQSVVHLHGSDSVVASNFVMRWLARRVMRSATHCLAVSEELADWGRELSSRSVLICPMPISDLFTKSDVPPPIDGPVLAVGRLVHEKGFDVLIRAVAELGKADRPKVVIVGEGPEREALLNKALVSQVELDLPGSLSPRRVSAWYSKARFVVVPSRREGFGLVAAEAAASGRAVIGTRVGAIPDLVADGVSGLLVEPDNVLELVAALKRVDPDWGLAGPAMTKALSPEAHSLSIVNLYDESVR
jgi:glycosyltransferase involved in cell wall biosynthesis